MGSKSNAETDSLRPPPRRAKGAGPSQGLPLAPDNQATGQAANPALCLKKVLGTTTRGPPPPGARSRPSAVGEPGPSSPGIGTPVTVGGGAQRGQGPRLPSTSSRAQRVRGAPSGEAWLPRQGPGLASTPPLRAKARFEGEGDAVARSLGRLPRVAPSAASAEGLGGPAAERVLPTRRRAEKPALPRLPATPHWRKRDGLLRSGHASPATARPFRASLAAEQRTWRLRPSALPGGWGAAGAAPSRALQEAAPRARPAGAPRSASRSEGPGRLGAGLAAEPAENESGARKFCSWEPRLLPPLWP
ncbi:uncharacterized protein LOC143819671 [Paroedura picta]|uniref:uncharacterized protein LOC143819671 n=1 Tax=Paroedura picta TaxID=143630 RepID=UPI004057A39F